MPSILVKHSIGNNIFDFFPLGAGIFGDTPVFCLRPSRSSTRCLSPNIFNYTLPLFSLCIANTTLLIARHAIAKDLLIVFCYMYLHNVV